MVKVDVNIQPLYRATVTCEVTVDQFEQITEYAFDLGDQMDMGAEMVAIYSTGANWPYLELDGDDLKKTMFWAQAIERRVLQYLPR